MGERGRVPLPCCALPPAHARRAYAAVHSGACVWASYFSCSTWGVGGRLYYMLRGCAGCMISFRGVYLLRAPLSAARAPAPHALGGRGGQLTNGMHVHIAAHTRDAWWCWIPRESELCVGPPTQDTDTRTGLIGIFLFCSREHFIIAGFARLQ